jgi:hypothetical protein
MSPDGKNWWLFYGYCHGKAKKKQKRECFDNMTNTAWPRTMSIRDMSET